MHAQAPDLIAKLASQFGSLTTNANPLIKSKAFDDSQIKEHFGIIPTGVMPRFTDSQRAEKSIYETIVRRYLAQFYPDYQTLKASLVIAYDQDEFKVNASQELQLGWKVVEPPTKVKKEGVDAAPSKVTVQTLALYKVGQTIQASQTGMEQGKTTPPEKFTEDSLIRDMENAGKYAKTAEDRAILKSSEGIGTARTREPTLAALLRRELLLSKKVGKRHELTASPIGREMIGRLPIWLTDVATTAKWEKLLGAIEQGEVSAQQVIDSQIVNVKQIIDRAKSQMPQKAA
jgi:DNA topoisomerase-3